MSTQDRRNIFFSLFMFTADLRPDDLSYRRIVIDHLKALTDMGYDGFDAHIAALPPSVDHAKEVESYARLRDAIDRAGLHGAKFTTNVGTTRTFDPTSPYADQRAQALAYLKSRVEITRVLGGASIMSGPFLYPYGVFPQTDTGEGLWSDALLDWMEPRYLAARSLFDELADYAGSTGGRPAVKLAIEPVKSWETPPPNMVSEALGFLQGVKSSLCGVTVDTAQVVMESQGPEQFRRNVAQAVAQGRLHYVHISAPDRGKLTDCWLPWDFMLGEIDPVYDGPYLVEVFNAVPPFDSSMRMARRRFWRPGEDAAMPGLDSAYDVARAGLKELRDRLAAVSGVKPAPPLPPVTGKPEPAPLPDPIKMLTRTSGEVRIHTFVSAYTGNNIADGTHIVEGPSKLVIFDGQFLVPYAKQFREFADGLVKSSGKPIDRLYLTHRHPDHWFGIGVAFEDIQVHALPETIEFLKLHAADAIASHKVKLGDLAPDTFYDPDRMLPVIIPEGGTFVDEIDRVKYEFSMLVDTEIDYHMIIGLPDHRVCVVQDLIYSETHLYLTPSEDMARWIAFLETMLLSDYDLFLAGHGLPADKSEVARNIEYLAAARDAIADGYTGDAFKDFLLKRYPARLCPAIFDIYLPRLFSGAQQY